MKVELTSHPDVQMSTTSPNEMIKNALQSKLIGNLFSTQPQYLVSDWHKLPFRDYNNDAPDGGKTFASYFEITPHTDPQLPGDEKKWVSVAYADFSFSPANLEKAKYHIGRQLEEQRGAVIPSDLIKFSIPLTIDADEHSYGKLGMARLLISDEDDVIVTKHMRIGSSDQTVGEIIFEGTVKSVMDKLTKPSVRRATMREFSKLVQEPGDHYYSDEETNKILTELVGLINSQFSHRYKKPQNNKNREDGLT
ncbi:hypothetical protein COY90_03515 [Candidatus Roizmanbacteria bacterium CG_4_10_14_0_8_um_filter_39_9]|uniref:Uncharacterized protein n=1 Tax=Candidatus Roizmanbacteria bacterium CG_4_10_14_0_8_um_filter_39_9 TaxID=1974829 RepID=A0A2M7QCD8_9BACT|nr:MAG: hypothetical protein COY90_03515 [Candidatus Roizmanbacteria bacterium CG_4_10_14_0_8_um_filter_39_9]